MNIIEEYSLRRFNKGHVVGYTGKALKFTGTLVLIPNDKGNKVLLAIKQRKIGAGKLNAYGGGVEVGETPIQGAKREAEQETKSRNGKGGIKIKRLKKVALITFNNERLDSLGGGMSVCTVHVYIATQWSGHAYSNNEMAHPDWYRIAKLPAHRMMLADREWMPRVLSGKIRPNELLIGKVWYRTEQVGLAQPSEWRIKTVR